MQQLKCTTAAMSGTVAACRPRRNGKILYRPLFISVVLSFLWRSVAATETTVHFIHFLFYWPDNPRTSQVVFFVSFLGRFSICGKSITDNLHQRGRTSSSQSPLCPDWTLWRPPMEQVVSKIAASLSLCWADRRPNAALLFGVIVPLSGISLFKWGA